MVRNINHQGTYEVFHHVGRREDREGGCLYGRFYNEFDPECPTFNEAEWRHIANVECGDLEQVFYLTNHVDRDWTTHDEIEWCFGGPGRGWLRSTSVGDVVRTPSGRYLLCAGMGWEDITDLANEQGID